MLNKQGIKARRQELRLTMEEAAKLAGMISKQKWNDFENATQRNPTLATMLKVARALRCSIADLVIEDYQKRKR